MITSVNQINALQGSIYDPPLKQAKLGIPNGEIKCVSGTILMLNYNHQPACISVLDVHALNLRGWKLPDGWMLLSSTIDKNHLTKAPSLAGITNYINTTPTDLSQEMKGKVILYDFWNYRCINCIRTIPYVVDWNEKYSKSGLLIIGIHTPEFAWHKDPQSIKKFVNDNGISYPVVIDNEMKTWNAFGNIYWPRQYLVDADGYIRYNHIGEGDYDEIEKVIQNLLVENTENK